MTKAITVGNAQNSFAKTAASFSVLTAAITAGEAELVNASATAESLNAATQAINDAIAGFELLPGYTYLTKDMYKNWDSATDPTTSTDASGACSYVLNEPTSQPYGHGNVPLLTFADLSTFDNLYVLATGAGTPRILLNRDIDNGQCSATESESHLIDNTNADCLTWASRYFTTEGKNVTVDLKQLATNKGFAHLHTIKAAGGNVTVSDMLLYRTPKTVTIGSAGYATFSADKAVKIQGVTAYAAKLNGNTVTLTPVTEVPANNAVILEGAADTYNFTVLDNAAAIANNDLLVSDGNASGSNIYVLADGANGVGFYKLASSDKVPAGKGYLTIGSGAAPEFEEIPGLNIGPSIPGLNIPGGL